MHLFRRFRKQRSDVTSTTHTTNFSEEELTQAGTSRRKLFRVAPALLLGGGTAIVSEIAVSSSAHAVSRSTEHGWFRCQKCSGLFYKKPEGILIEVPGGTGWAGGVCPNTDNSLGGNMHVSGVMDLMPPYTRGECQYTLQCNKP